MNESFSEYVLYEPILRILSARGYSVQCEVECPGIEQPPVGDRKKLDFVATQGNLTFAIEVKWVKRRRPEISEDLRKLEACRKKMKWQTFLCIFGTESNIANVQLSPNLKERGDPVIASFKKTRYGCRVYEWIEKPKQDKRCS